MIKNQGAGFLFYTSDSVLLLLKAKNLLWEIPGGKKKQNEKHIEAAKRETKEEIGKLPKHTRTGFQLIETDKHEFKIYFGKVLKKFSCKISDEHLKWKWIKIDKLKDYKLHPKVEKAVQFIKNTLHGPKKSGDWFSSF